MSGQRRVGCAWPVGLFMLGLAWSPAALVEGKDTVVLKSGRNISGVVILSERYDKVEVDRDDDGKADDTFAAGDIATVSYGDAPMSFREGLLDYRMRRYEEAVGKFEKAVEEPGVRQFWLQQHANYMLGECRRRLAMNDPQLLAKARAAYEQVVEKVPDGRWAPNAIEGIGICLLQEGDAEGARGRFEKLIESGKYGEEWTLRGNLLMARALSKSGKHEEALALCRDVEREAAPGLDQYVTDAALTRAELLMATGKHQEAQETFVKIAREADARDIVTKAKAYNCVADALLAANRTQEALLAYLRVRVLYFKAADELPHALYGAARCFTILRKANEAREVVALLGKEYPRSIWTVMAKKELGG